MGTVEREETFLEQLLRLFLLSCLGQSLALTNLLLGLSQILGSQLALYSHKFLDQGLILLKHLVVALGYGTTNNKRCTGIVNQYGVHLIDDGIIM